LYKVAWRYQDLNLKRRYAKSKFYQLNYIPLYLQKLSKIRFIKKNRLLDFFFIQAVNHLLSAFLKSKRASEYWLRLPSLLTPPLSEYGRHSQGALKFFSGSHATLLSAASSLLFDGFFYKRKLKKIYFLRWLNLNFRFSSKKKQK
jgi:hypothetical protein